MDGCLAILCLEDSREDAELVREQLAGEGVQMRMDWAANEPEFEALIRRGEYDVILADYQLPGYDAPEALRLATRLCPATPFICVSGAIGEDTAAELLRLGATDYVRKDRLARLPLAVRRAVEEARERRTRQRTETALKESEERYRELVENMNDVVFAASETGRLTYLSPAVQAVLGYSPDEVVGRSLAEFVHPDDLPEVQRLFAGLLAGRLHPSEYRVLAKDGSVRWVRSSSRPRYEAGRAVGIQGILSDITERKRAEDQLRQAQKLDAIGGLAGGVAHDFNNALGVIIGYAELALRRLDAHDPLHRHLGEILRTARRSADLTRQLLAFARRQPVAPRVLGLNDAIASLSSMLRRLIGEDIDLRIVPGNRLWNVKIDPSQVDQILVNLATNARDAVGGQGTLTVETANATLGEEHQRSHPAVAPGDYVRLSVSDSGAGMDRATQDRIFEPFFTTKASGGTGLGLATVYGIVRQNGGLIDVYSEPGHGTTFKIYLPRSADEAEAPSQKKERGLLTGTETVLIVEDEPQLLEIAQESLQSLGYTVLAAGSPGDAILLCETHPGKIDVLVTDVVMPTMNGKELRQRLEALKPGLRAVFMSGYTADVVANRGVVDADVLFVQKPFTIEALAAKVREALRD